MFMNRVHEQCPKVDSGKIPSQIGSKTGRVHRVHSPRRAHTPSPRTQRPGCAPAAPCRACTPVLPAHARLRLPAALRAVPHSSARAPYRPAHLSAHAPAPSVACAPAQRLRAVSWPSWALCRDTAYLIPTSGHNTL